LQLQADLSSLSLSLSLSLEFYHLLPPSHSLLFLLHFFILLSAVVFVWEPHYFIPSSSVFLHYFLQKIVLTVSLHVAFVPSFPCILCLLCCCDQRKMLKSALSTCSCSQKRSPTGNPSDIVKRKKTLYLFFVLFLKFSHIVFLFCLRQEFSFRELKRFPEVMYLFK
jgi:hypothetical protein